MRVAGGFTLDGLALVCRQNRRRSVQRDRTEPATPAITIAAGWAVGRHIMARDPAIDLHGESSLRNLIAASDVRVCFADVHVSR
ncbi:hypothetical protein BZL30_9345 [Mycobacterium kansasii]|uniref:Uncharacterized protein n=1 Tax=Mycobacterium kansasii TaxID=1768 RepID=A0A1V3WAE7_MYCKA|nr:hypothetical protein BZL30_9345 [Mycobacterium kansasii]